MWWSNRENEIPDMAKLYDLAIVVHIHIEFLLLMVLVERWDPDTNTFHLPTEKMTVNLLDIY